jgi:subfamily B ATP-binding cassette protein MsbA
MVQKYKLLRTSLSPATDKTLIFALMRDYLEIYRLTFVHKGRAWMVIICNLLFVVFNLLSLVLFIPFLQLIFSSIGEKKVVEPPHWDGGIFECITYVKDYYNYYTQELVNHDPSFALTFVCVSVLLAFLLKNLFRYGAVWHQSELRMAVVRDLRNQLFQKAMHLPLSFYTDERKGDLMSRMNNDVGEIEIAVVSILELIYREPIAILINVSTLIYLSPKLTLISFILLPISALVISRIGKSLKRTAKEGQEQMGLLYSTLEEGLGGIRVIKAFNAVNQVYGYFKSVNLRHQQLITKAFRKRDLSPILNETLGAVVMLSLVWFGGSMILESKSNGEMTGEVFLTFVIVFSQLLRPIQGIATSVAALNKAKASQDRINEVLFADEKITESEKAISKSRFEHSIRFQNVSFSYKDTEVLQHINLIIPKGKAVALVGESGSGKSTICDLIPRFYDVQKGGVFIDDIPIEECKIEDLRNLMGLVSQEPILFNATVRENIAFGQPSASQKEIEEAAKVAYAHDFIVEMERGYDTVIGDRGSKLSGGQRQRISIARAVLRNPEILLLDEATAALDTESEKMVQESLEKLMKGRTTIMVAHRLSTVRNADEIVVLSKGKIVEQGTHVKLMEKRGVYHSLCALQGIHN